MRARLLMSGDEIEWSSGPAMFDFECDVCGVVRHRHDDDALGHIWWGVNPEPRTKTWINASMRTSGREQRGDYAALLPADPSDRRRIRKATGWTQQMVAEEIGVSRATIHKFEKRAGWLPNGERLSGRDPSGHVRELYSALLRRLAGGGPVNRVGIDRSGRW